MQSKEAQGTMPSQSTATKKDRLTALGIGGALAAIFVSMIMEGTSPASLIKVSSLILVFAGTFAAAAAGVLRSDVKNVKSVLKKALGARPQPLGDDITTIIGLAEVARREGLLALDRAASAIEEPFFRKGVELIVDGTDPEEVAEILEGEIEALHDRHRVGAKFFSDMGGFAPTLGILGTVIGLVHVLADLNNPGKLGPAIAAAFTATLWGVLSANIVWLPISNKLKRLSDAEVRARRLVLDGVLAIQAGISPRMIEARLLSYMTNAERTAFAEVRGSAKSKAAGEPDESEEAA